MIRALGLAVIVGTVALPAVAFDFSLPATARQTVSRDTGPDRFDAPIAVFDGDRVPMIAVEGDVARSAWRIDSPGVTAFQVMRPLRTQLAEAGFDIALDCAAEACGGFDFRFAMETLPGPNMYVNIRSYHVVTGIRGANGEIDEVVNLLTSTSATSAYVQIIHAGALAERGLRIATEADVPVAAPADVQDSFSARLMVQGHIVLTDLEFASGSADLGSGPFGSLSDLAAFLQNRPGMRVALVGHTDTVGGLAGNIAISRARAQSVRQRLIDGFNLPAAQMDAEGMGYLAPLASNLEAAGRDRNRRVEVVLLSAQ